MFIAGGYYSGNSSTPSTLDCPSTGSASLNTILFGLNSVTDPNYASGVFTITLTAGMDIINPVVINGTSQSGCSSTPCIHLNETASSDDLITLDTGSDGSTVKGLMFSNTVGQIDLLITHAGGMTVQSNYFDTDGASLQGSSVVGVDISSSTTNLIGGPLAANRNLFGDTSQYGVYVQNPGSTGNLIQGNYFGVQADGITAITGQSSSGTAIVVYATSASSANNTVRGNLITKFEYGVWVALGSAHTTISGNTIGLGIDGSTPLGGGNDAIFISDSSSNTVGGVTAADRNVIAEYSSGVHISKTSGSSDNNVIEGNYIGTDATGSIAKPNLYGINISAGDGNMIGGTVAGSGNLISGNANGGLGSGIFVQNTSTNTQIFENRIGTDAAGSLAIPNDAGIRVMGTTAVIGNNTTAGKNLISGNGDGILIQNFNGTSVFCNKIGTNLAGTAALANTFDGINVNNASAQIANNWIGYNPIGFLVDGTSTIVSPSSNNCFARNTSYGVQNGNTVSANFGKNWWGAANGPGPIGPGSGDHVSTHVNFSSWLTVPPLACSLKLLSNSDFETDANHDNKPDNWTITGFNPLTDKRDCTVHKTGKCSLKLAGTNKQKVASQTISRSSVAGDDFTFSLWSKAAGIPAGSVYRLQVIFYNNASVISTKTMKFTTGTHGFTNVTGAFTTPGPYTKIVFKVILKASSGTAWFDTAGLNWAP